MGLPAGYGKANNPTGVGGFQPGVSGALGAGKQISAGKQMNILLADALMANDAKAVKKHLANIISKFESGDEWASDFVWNRMAGRPAQTVALGGTGEDGDPIRHVVEFVIVDPGPR